MKKIVYYNLLLAILGLSFFSSCKNEVDDVFDLPSTQRMQKYIDDCNQILTSSEYGWRVDYRTKTGLFLNLVIKFSETGQKYGKINMQLVNPDSVANTRQEDYIIENYEGPVLNFSTYSALAVYADPKLNGGKGMGADIEFVIRQVTPDSIVCAGRKYGDSFVLKKAIKGELNRIHLQRAMDYTYDATQNMFFGISGTQTDVEYLNRDNLKISTAEGQSVNSELVYDEEGFSLKTPVVAGGQNLTKFLWNNKLKRFELQGSTSTLAPVGAPYYSLGNTAEEVRGKAFEITELSSSVYSIYNQLLQNKKLPGLTGLQFYCEKPSKMINMYYDLAGKDTIFTKEETVDEIMTSCDFVYTLREHPTWNYMKAKEVSYPRADKIKLVSDAYGDRGDLMRNISREAAGKKIINLFYQGEIVVVKREGKTFLVNSQNSANWMIIEPAEALKPDWIQKIENK